MIHQYQVTVKNTEDYVFQATSEGHQLLIDADGKKAITPLANLLASLLSCMGFYLKKFAEREKLSLFDFQLSAKAELLGESPWRFKKILVTVDLGRQEIAEVTKKQIELVLTKCPVHNTLKNNPEISIDFLKKEA